MDPAAVQKQDRVEGGIKDTTRRLEAAQSSMQRCSHSLAHDAGQGNCMHAGIAECLLPGKLSTGQH